MKCLAGHHGVTVSSAVLVVDALFSGLTLQMSRAPQRHDRTGQRARRLHLDVSQLLDAARTRPDRTSVIRHAESTERRTLTKSRALFGPIYFDVRRCTAVPEN